MRRLGTISLLGLLPLGVAGCGGDEVDRAEVDGVEQQAVDAVDGVLHDLSERTRAEFVSGNRFFSVCGAGYDPRGVVMRSHLQLGSPAELPSDDAADLAGTLLEDDGWTVERWKQAAVVEGAKGELNLRIEFDALTVVSIHTDCIETSDGVAEEYSGRDVEVRWK